MTVLANWQARVTAIAEGRARLVSDWFNARHADADVLASSPAVRALMLDGGRGGDVRGQIVPQLDRVAGAYGYAGITLLDVQGRVLARSTGAAELGRDSSESAILAARSRTMRVDLVEEANRKLLLMNVPVFAEGGFDTSRPVMGVVALAMKPEARLFPLLNDETVPTKTGETLLFRADGPKPTYISPLKGDSAGWSAVDRSLETLVPLAKRAAEGRNTFGEMFDYRAAPVFAATRWIAPAGWGLVLKVDREEALADFYQAGKLAGFGAAFLTLALGGLLLSLWRQGQRASLLREQMKQERAIFNLKGYAEKIVASVPSGLLLLSADLRVLSANRSFLESFFMRRDEVLGRGFEDLVRADGLVRRAREVMQSGTAQPDLPFEFHLLHRQETRRVRVTITSIRIEEQEEARLLLIVEDLSEEERLQAARKESEQRFQDLVQGLDAIVWEADAATLRFSFVSQRAQTVFGFPPDRWLDEPDFFSKRIHPEDRGKVMAKCRGALARGEDHELEYRALTATGEIVWLRDIVHVVPDTPGNAGQLRGLTVDLTDLKRADEALRTSEDQLRQAQKMDAVGKLAGGIAHDFNNLLMVIRGDGDLILRRLPPSHPLRKNAEGIREAADQAATLTRQLLAFSRKQVLAPKVLDLNGIVAGMQTMLQRLIGETINLVTVPEADARSRQGRSGPDRAGHHEPGGQCPRRHAGRRAADDPHLQHPSGRGAAASGRREPAGGPARAARGERQRLRHGRRHPGAPLRAVLHDQGGRQGHGPRTVHGVRHRRAERRLDHGRDGAGARHDVPHLPAEGRSAGHRAGRAAGSGSPVGRLLPHCLHFPMSLRECSLSPPAPRRRRSSPRSCPRWCRSAPRPSFSSRTRSASARSSARSSR